MRSREYGFLLKKKIKKYQCKRPTYEYVRYVMNNFHLFTLKNVRGFLIKD